MWQTTSQEITEAVDELKFLDSFVRSEQSAASKLGFTMTLCIVLVIEKP